MADFLYFVNTDIGTGGGDGSIGSPWDSLATAIADSGLIAAAVPGNNITIMCSGAANDNITSQIVWNGNHTMDTMLVLGTGASAESMQASNYTLASTDSTVIRFASGCVGDRVKFQGLQFDCATTGSNAVEVIEVSGTSPGAPAIRVHNCRFRINQGSTGTAVCILHGDDDSNDNIHVNNIIEFTGAGTGLKWAIRCSANGASAKLYNSIVADNNTGGGGSEGAFQFRDGSAIKNSAFVKIDDAFQSGGGTIAVSNNLSDDGSGDSGFTDVPDWDVYYTDVDNGDFTLAPSSPAATNGVNVAAENGDGPDGLTLGITTGIDGVTERGGTWEIGPEAIFDAVPPTINNIDGDNAVNQYQSAVVSLTAFTETITAATLNSVACVIIDSDPIDDEITIRVPGTLASGTYDLFISGATESDTLNGVSYTQTHPYAAPPPGAYDSNSIWVGSTFPADTFFREIDAFDFLTFGNGFTGWGDAPTQNNIMDYIVAPPGYEGSDSAALELLGPDGTLSSFVINVTVTGGDIIVGNGGLIGPLVTNLVKPLVDKI